VRVNQRPLKVDLAIACLYSLWDEVRLVERLLNTCLIQEALEQEPIELSGAVLQQAMDAFRRARRLYTAGETREWMERHGITHEKLEQLIASQSIVNRLRERVTAGQVEPYFEARRDPA
jgi:putative peptide maturation system protein